MIYQAEKQLKELGDKVPTDLKSNVEARVGDLKDAAQTEDLDKMKRAQENLQQELMQIGQAIYGNKGAGTGPAQPGPESGGKSGADDAEVIDADFTDSL